MSELGPRAARRARAEEARRVPALLAVAVAVAALVAIAAAVDGRPPTAAGEGAAASPAALAPVAPAADALGSTWYCAGGTGREGGADHSVQVANSGDQPLPIVLTVVPGAAHGQPAPAEAVIEEHDVPARGTLNVRLEDVVAAPFLAAIVEVGSGEVVVEHAVTGGGDVDTAPCASSSSGSWYLAAGATTRDATEHLILFNPFPDDAVVDVTFTTPDGLRSPPAFAGFIVPGRRVVAVDVGAVVSRYPNVSTSVVARSGRLVVDRLQRFDSSGGPPGLAITTAAPAPAEVWHLPDGLVAQGVTEVVTIYNPGEQQAEVDVEVTLDPTSDPAAPQAADPFVLSIPPLQFAQVAVHDDDRVPDGRGHALTVRSQNGVPVVAERWVRSGAPATRAGFAATLASPVVATRWLSAFGSTTTGQSEVLVIVNPDPSAIARVSVTAPTPTQDLPLAGLEDVEVPAAGRVVLDIGQHVTRDSLALVVESTLPIVVERGLFGTSGGLAQSILVPATATASIPPVDPTGAGPS